MIYQFGKSHSSLCLSVLVKSVLCLTKESQSRKMRLFNAKLMEPNLILQRNKMHSNPPKCRVMEKSCQMVGKFARKSQDYCVVPWHYGALFFVPLSKKEGGLVILKQQDANRAFFLSSQKHSKIETI